VWQWLGGTAGKRRSEAIEWWWLECGSGSIGGDSSQFRQGSIFDYFFSEFASAGLVRRAGLEAVGVALAGWYRWKEEIGGYRMVVDRAWQWQYWRRYLTV
jgi:hypothetical protein